MTTNQTNHYKNKRYRREKFIDEYLGGDGEVIDIFVVDNNHRNGLERHCITNNGLIVIYNVRTNKLITKLIAREGQIKRYYRNVGREPPRYLIDLARWHKSLGYNNI